jgi:hypothetical protein
MGLIVNQLFQHQPEHIFRSGADEKPINATCGNNTARSTHQTVENGVKRL